jgi:hypothetical protein
MNDLQCHCVRLSLASSLVFTVAASLHASTVQLDCTSVLNARPVSVVHHEKLIPWSTGVDGGGKADGFATVSAARAHGDPTVHALPDDGRFPANNDHPFVQLPYSAAGESQFQAGALSGESEFELELQRRAFHEISLFFTSAEGASQLSIIVHYDDGTGDTRAVEMPDYYRAPLPRDKDLFALASDLAKWNVSGNIAEGDHHYIYGWKIKLDPNRGVKSITVHKAAAGYAVFWGATADTAK